MVDNRTGQWVQSRLFVTASWLVVSLPLPVILLVILRFIKLCPSFAGTRNMFSIRHVDASVRREASRLYVSKFSSYPANDGKRAVGPKTVAMFFVRVFTETPTQLAVVCFSTA